jgi:hypothetical protein
VGLPGKCLKFKKPLPITFLGQSFFERFAMAIGPVSSNTPLQAPAKAAQQESAVATAGSKDLKNDGDADDKTSANAAVPTPVVNTLGQQLGRNLNVSA